MRLTSVTKRFGAQAALLDVNLEVQRGEIFGVIGESGAGKSTLLNLLTAELAADAGEVEVLGERLSSLNRSALRALRQRIGVLFQDVHLLSNLTIEGNIGLPLRIAGKGNHRQSIAEMLSFVGLSGYASRFPAQLSGGQQQRVGIARALVSRPALLLCDEPTSALDSSTAAGILRLLADARARFGATVIIVTHDLEAVRAICDRVALFEGGVLRQVLHVKKRPSSTDQSYLERAREVLEGE